VSVILLQVGDWLDDITTKEGLDHNIWQVLPHALLSLEMSRSHKRASRDMKDIDVKHLDILLHSCKARASNQVRCKALEPIHVYLKALKKFDPKCFNGECPFHLVESIVRKLTMNDATREPLSPEVIDDIITTTSMFILDSKDPLAKLRKTKEEDGDGMLASKLSNFVVTCLFTNQYWNLGNN
jgi:hypothetical protein